MDTANLYQGVFNVALAAIARDDRLGTVSGRLAFWARSSKHAAERLTDTRAADAQQFAAEVLEPAGASALATRVLPGIVSLRGLADVIERHLSDPTVALAKPDDTVRLIVYGEERSPQDHEGNLSYVLANYVPQSLKIKLEQDRYDIVGSRIAADVQRLGDTQKVLDYWPKHPHAQFDPKLIAMTKILKYSHLLASAPHIELKHRIEYDADLDEQPLTYRQERARDYIAALQTKSHLHLAVAHHVQQLAEREPADLQLEFLNKFYYAGPLDKILHYNYCVAEPDSHELAIFEALMNTIPHRIFSGDAVRDRIASQDALRHFHDPERPENSRISPVVRIELPTDRRYKILDKA